MPATPPSGSGPCPRLLRVGAGHARDSWRTTTRASRHRHSLLAHADAHPCASAACIRGIVPDDPAVEGRSPGEPAARSARTIAVASRGTLPETVQAQMLLSRAWRAPTPSNPCQKHLPVWERAIPATSTRVGAGHPRDIYPCGSGPSPRHLPVWERAMPATSTHVGVRRRPPQRSRRKSGARFSMKALIAS
jgi:hypothetical protein